MEERWELKMEIPVNNASRIYWRSSEKVGIIASLKMDAGLSHDFVIVR